jgi:hypothetical protein
VTVALAGAVLFVGLKAMAAERGGRHGRLRGVLRHPRASVLLRLVGAGVSGEERADGGGEIREGRVSKLLIDE